MDRAGLEPRSDLEPDRPLRWPGDDDQRPVAGLRIAQGDVAAAPGLRVELAAGRVDVDPARLGELRGVGDRPDGGPDGVVAAPGRVGLHGAGVGPDDLVVDRIDGAPDLELRDAVAGVELVHQAGHVERTLVAPLAAGLAPFLAGPQAACRSVWPSPWRRGRACWSICHGSRPST